MSIESFTSNKPYLFQAIYQWILDNDATPHILVDANWPLVSVPQQFVQQGKIILNAAPEAINNWYSDNEAVSFSARFAGQAQDIYLPIASILAIYAQENNLGMTFEQEALPAEKKSPSMLPETHSVKQQKQESMSQDKKQTDMEKSKQAKKSLSKKTSHLKIIK